MLIKKRPYQFWHYRDTRKQSVALPKAPAIIPIITDQPKAVTGIISHHILLPLAELPFELVARIQADLTLMNPEYLSAKKYGKGFVSYAIPEYVRLYTMDTTYIGLPRSIRMPYLYNRFNEHGLKLVLQDVRPEFESIPFPSKGIITPLFYQKEAIDQIINGNVVIKLKCGKGKTILALLAVENIRLRTLILVRTTILQSQWVEAIKEVFDIPEDQIGVINGDTKREGLITVALEQSLVELPREDKRRLGRTYGHLIIDEAHECAAQRYRELMTYFKARKVTGLTWTPDREDDMTPVLKLYIGPIVEIDDLGDIETTVNVVKSNFFYNFVGKKDKYHKLIEAIIRDQERNQLIIESIKKYIAMGRVIVCYSGRIEHMETLRALLTEQMPDVKSDILASKRNGIKMSIEDQEAVKARLDSQEIQVLFGGKIIEQGFNCKPLSVALLSTPTKSRRLIEQILGRCQREFFGKKDVYLVEIMDEKTKVLLYQFFSKNRRIYKKYRKVYG